MNPALVSGFQVWRVYLRFKPCNHAHCQIVLSTAFPTGTDPGAQPRHVCHCGKRYIRIEHLRRHQAMHGDPSYVCGICGRSYTRTYVFIHTLQLIKIFLLGLTNHRIVMFSDAMSLAIVPPVQAKTDRVMPASPTRPSATARAPRVAHFALEG